jgi:hypothetical protein
VVDAIPLLGSGKPDFVAATKLAAQRSAPKAAELEDTSDPDHANDSKTGGGTAIEGRAKIAAAQ